MEWVVTDNIYDETWRRLLEYANSDLAVAEIVRRHGPAATKRDEANYRKQARQIRVSVLQAKEYFDAARSSSIVTSPNHVYYGCVALASMMMLLMSDGTRSLDWLRQDSKNAHHGLTFTTGCGEGRAAVGFELVQNSWVEILLNGHFGNWYSSLPRFVDAHALVTRHLDGATIQSFQSVGRAAVPALSEIAGKKYSVMDCMKALPDLVTTLGRYGVELDTSRTTYTIDVLHNGSQKHVWALHGAQTAMALERVMAEFATKPEFADCFGVTGEATGVGAVHGALISFDYAAGGGATFKWPNTRVALDHTSVCFAGGSGVPEIVDCYLIAYQLSMLSRYFPDIWIACLESQCKAAKLIEQQVVVASLKVPVLTLSMLSPLGIVVSTHREPWKRM